MLQFLFFSTLVHAELDEKQVEKENPGISEDELNNLATNPEYRSVRKKMEKNLRKLIKELDHPVEAPALL